MSLLFYLDIKRKKEIDNQIYNITKVIQNVIVGQNN